ncbi:acyl-CoA dehydrogenase family protein [Streptomyces sp. NPDC058307]|uniref:acyl-CoA dehydrogenase family protein n=1 Tax=Streptomyces sp. NPDC058307 TaxID=3346439 RepID=UPI0036E60012
MNGLPRADIAEGFSQWLGTLADWARKHRDGTVEWRDVAATGLLSLTVPEHLGGAGAGFEAVSTALETAAAGCGPGGLWFAVCAHLLACQEPLVAFGDSEQQQRFLPGMMTGDVIGAHASTEYEAGSDVLSVRTAATHAADGAWTLNGSKSFVTNGPIADVFLVLARTAPGSPLAGLTSFLVPRGTPGLSVGPPLEKAGLQGSSLGTLRLDDCELPDSACLGGAGAGYAVLTHTMRIERALILAPTLGLMERALQSAVEHARMRRQFGQRLADFDSVRDRLVTMKINLVSAREMLQATARQADSGRLDHARSALTKVHVSRCFNEFCNNLVDVYGGYALLPETGAGLLLDDAVASRFYSGTSDLNRKIVAQGLGL